MLNRKDLCFFIFFLYGSLILSSPNNPGIIITTSLINKIHHDRGIVSTARSLDINSAGSQFFICITPQPHLDEQYTVFGKVIKGMDVVDKISLVPRDMRDKPITNVVMKSVKVIKK